MKKMNYTIKRQAKRITFHTMCKELGIDKNTYKEVEEGLKNLEGKYLEKFNYVIKNAKLILMERKIKMIDIDKWYKENDLKQKAKEMGYNFIQLAAATGLSYPTLTRLSNKIEYCGDDVKEELYDFLNNGLNKKVKSEKEVIEEPAIETIEDKAETTHNDIVVDKACVPKDNNERELKNIEELELEIKALKRQIYLYEKLIERL